MSWCVNARKRVLAFAQVAALLRMIERDGKKLDVGAFLDRFQVVYSRATEEGLTASESNTGRRVRSLLARVGAELLRLHGKSRIQVCFQFFPLMRITLVRCQDPLLLQRVPESRHRGYSPRFGLTWRFGWQIFEEIDTNGDGFIQEDEFYTMLSRMQLEPPLSDADLKDMWRYVDANSDGHLNYFEFCAAFQVVRLTWTRLNCFLTVGNGDDSSVRDGVDSQNEK